MFQKGIIIGLGVVLSIILVMYIKQGGFEEVKVEEKMSASRYIVGYYYEGSYTDTAFTELFPKILALKEQQNLSGVPGAVYYNDPEESKGLIKAFLGVIERQRPADIEDVEIRELPSEKVVSASLNASSAFVRKAYNAIFEYAKENQITLEQQYIEWFPSEDKIEVEIIIKNK